MRLITIDFPTKVSHDYRMTDVIMTVNVRQVCWLRCLLDLSVSIWFNESFLKLDGTKSYLSSKQYIE